MTRRAGVVVVGLAGLLVAGEAHSDDHRWPRANLEAGHQRQAGRIIDTTWMRRNRADECVVSFGVDFGFPRALRYSSGETRIRMRKDEMPLEWSLEAWRQVRRNGSPRGRGVPVPALLVPRIREGRATAWDLRFVPPFASGHTHLMATGYWADETRCAGEPDLGSQSASWTFHYRRSR